MRTETISLYKFGELSKEVKNRLIDKNRDINVNDFWYDYLIYDFKDELKKIGVSCENFYFSFDRDRHIYMSEPIVEDEEKFLKKCGKKELILIKLNNYQYEITIKNYNDKNKVEVDLTSWAEETEKGYNESRNFEHQIEKRLTESLNKYLNKFLKKLEKEYYYFISDEAIQDNLINSDFEYTKEGISY